MLGIVIPLKSSVTSSCWENTSRSLIATLKSVLNQNNIDIDSIKKYYFHKNKRWDLYFKNNLIIKLPNQNIDDAIKLFNKFQKEKKIKKNSIIDLRLLNRIIITHG